MDEKNLLIVIQSNDEKAILDALRSVEEGGGISLIKTVIALLKHPNKLVARQAVISAAGLIKRQLVDSWGDIEKNVKDGLASLLMKLNPAVIDHIAKDLYSEKEENRLRTLQVLGLLGQDDKIKQAVSEMLTDPDERLRATAISILKNMMNARDANLIYRVLHDSDPRVRANGVEALETMGLKAMVPSLASLRKDPNNRVRGNVLKALFNLGYKKIDPDLKDMLEHSNRLMRATAGWVLGEVGQSGEPVFIYLIGEYGLDRDLLVRQNMIKSLIKINNDMSLKICKYLFDEDEVAKSRAELEKMRKFRGK
ncbi:MAG: HEAT repeat domain-containing protein [Fibrobacterota bacterium]